MLRLKKKWFNPVYFHLHKYIDYPGIRKIMIYGGKDSSKTFSLAQLLSIKAYTTKASSICYRKEQTTIKKTLKPSFEKAIDKCYLQSVIDIMDFQLSACNGAKIVFTGLDTEAKVKGIESFKYLLCDELDHFQQEEWRQANLSLRGMEGQKLFATWNPVDENIWIKKELDAEEWTELPRIVDDNPYSQLDVNSFVRISKDGSTLLIKTTYLDNKWTVGGNGYGMVNSNLIAEYHKLKDFDENSYNVNVLGEWGVTNKEGKFCWAFGNQHIVKTVHDPELITYASFDFNLNPITCNIFQLLPEIKTLRGIESIQLENSDIWKLCDRVNASYPDVSWMITGDATGKAGSAMVENAMNYYKIIMQKLNVNDMQIKLPGKNPDIKSNQLLVNAVLKNWKVEFDPDNCAPLINDCRYVEMNGKGEIVKDRSSDKKFADHLDGLRYMINTFLRPFFSILTE